MDHNKHEFLSQEMVDEVARIFKALGDPTRIKILYLLSQEECSVGHIAELLHLSHSAVSHQLSLLRNLRLVKFRREAQVLYYTFEDEHVIEILKQTIDHTLHNLS